MSQALDLLPDKRLATPDGYVSPLLADERSRRKLLRLLELHPDWTERQLAAGLGARAGYRKRDIHALRQADPEVDDRYRTGRGYGDDQIRDEMQRRAIHGVDEPVFHQGEIVGHITRYSDRLLGLMAKAHLPEYRDQARLEVTGHDDGPVEIRFSFDPNAG
jgi:hypothetical protein